MAINCPKLPKQSDNVNNTEQDPRPKYNNAERLQKLYNRYHPAGVKTASRSSTDRNAPSYSQIAKQNNKGKAKEVQPNSTNSQQTVNHSRHNPNNTYNNANNSNLEKKLDLILNKLNCMQKSINNLNDCITKLEEWKAAFATQTETNSNQPESAPLIDLNTTTPSSSPAKRIRITSSSSSESDADKSPIGVNVTKPNPQLIINEQSEIIHAQQDQLNKYMEEINRLAS